MDELWRTVNALRWQTAPRLAAIARYREWLPRCKDAETRKYYKKWLDWLESETNKDEEEKQRKARVAALRIEKPD